MDKKRSCFFVRGHLPKALQKYYIKRTHANAKQKRTKKDFVSMDIIEYLCAENEKR